MNPSAETDAIRRLALLQLIREDGGASNDGTLLTAMRSIGHHHYFDENACRRLLTDLRDRDCVTIEMVRDTVMVATITERGRMAVAGHVAIGGIASPHRGL
jgi:hypothetical protein